jgi:hypothetical protein
MAENIDNSSLRSFVQHFRPFGVEYLVIGGQAAVLYGSPVPTFDVDLCYRRTAENLERLANALRGLHPALRSAPPDLPFRLDSRSLALGCNFPFQTDFGPFDLLGCVEPFGTYEDLRPRAESARVGDVDVFLIGLDDLITIK